MKGETKNRYIQSAILTYGIIAVFVSLTVWIAALRTVNISVKEGNERAALKKTRSLSKKLRHKAHGRVTDTRAVLKKWSQRNPEDEAAVIEEIEKIKEAPGSSVAAFKLVASTFKELPPGPLSFESVPKKVQQEAKKLYDWSAKTLHSKKPIIQWFSAPHRPETVGASLIISDMNDSRTKSGPLRILLLSAKPKLTDFSWPVFSWILLIILPGLMLYLWLWKGGEAQKWTACITASTISVLGCGVWLSGLSHMARRLSMDFGTFRVLKVGLGALFETSLVPAVILITILLAAGIISIAVTGLGRRMAIGLKTHRIAYLYVLPAAAGMVVLVLVPFVIGLGLGFFNHCEGEFEFVGLRNFADILSGSGAPLSHPLNFYFTLGVTILWTSLNVFLHLTVGLFLALLLRDPALKMKGVYRVLLIIPWAVPNYITALMWKGMFHQQYGAVNMILELMGIPAVSWFSSFWTAFSANVITNTWLGFPFMMVVCLGALQSIPQDLYEAAQVDGAGKWTTFTNITLPLLRPALMPAVILGSIWTFNMFNIIYLVSGGEPGGSTDILITEAYRWAFLRYERYGLAAAYATLIFIILLGYTYITNRATRASKS